MFLNQLSTERIKQSFPGFQVSDQSELQGKELDQAEINVIMFDRCIDYLRETFPDPSLNTRFTLLWRLIGNKLGVGVAQMELHQKASTTN